MLATDIPRAFGGVDWLLVAGCILALLGIGLYYGRKQRTTEEYFVAGRNRRSFVPGISLVAALFTLVAYIGNPGELVQHGPILLGTAIVAIPFACVIVGWFLIPFIMRLPITSAYELLEGRLGRPVRLLTSGTFVLLRLVWMSLILYTAAIVLVHVMDCDPRWVPAFAAGVGLVATFYTLVGGIDAVMLTSVLEFFLLLLGALLTLISITVRMGGVAAWWPHHWAPHWAPQPFFSLDPHVRVTVVGTFVAYVISAVCVAGSDQVAIQRFLTTRDVATARRAYIFGAVGVASLLLTLTLVGTALLGFYLHLPGGLPAGLSLTRAGDAFFPHYISHYLPPGISGLLVSALVASAVSGLSPGINSVVTVLAKDFLGFRAAQPEAAKLRDARLLSLLTGAAVIGGSQLMGSIGGDLVEVSGKSINIFFYPMFGIFFLAMFVRFATPCGAVLGAIYSLSAGILVGYWDVLTGLPRISFQWIAPISFATSLICGCLFSLLPTRGKPKGVVAGYFMTGIALLAVIVRLILRR